MLGPATSPTSTMVDWSDSHYQYVKNRILAINSARGFGGIVLATDWPSLEILPLVYYLIVSTSEPTRGEGPGSNSWFSPLFGMQVQWAWMIIGTDIQANALAANRGDRYRTSFQMQQEILQGCYPGFCSKYQYSTDSNADLIATPYNPPEWIANTKPRFSLRVEKQTGILFGSASVVLSSFTPDIAQ